MTRYTTYTADAAKDKLKELEGDGFTYCLESLSENEFHIARYDKRGEFVDYL